jgi:hypothetical protein
VAAAGAAYLVWRALDEVLGAGLAAQLASLGAGLAASVGVYLAACRALGVRELEAIRALGRGR